MYLQAHMESPATVSTVEALPKPDATKADDETVKVLVDIAIRRHDQLEKAYDTLNTRVGVIFGFSGFIAAAFFKAVEFLPDKRFQIPACFVFATTMVALAWQCKKAFGVAEVRGLPRPNVLWDKFANRVPLDLRAELISRLTEDFEFNHPIYTRKADRLQKAILLLFVQTVFILLVFLVAAGVKLASGWPQLASLFQP